MPTPDDSVGPAMAAPTPLDSADRSLHTTCPPEHEHQAVHTEAVGQHNVTLAGPAPESSEACDQTAAGDAALSPGNNVQSDSSEDSASTRTSPVDIAEHPKFDPSQFPASTSPSSLAPFAQPLPSPGIEPSTVRQSMPQHTSSFLRDGSKFVGTQQSDRQVYNVSVELKHVDMRESFVCGYLRIEGLTPDHPTLTTYFEGEIIGTKYTFQTRHSEWGVNEKVDMQHWNRFPAWRPLARQAKQANFSYKNYADREHLFMRWKEYFLVPNHRVTSISGASFEGFYYICFNQISGSVSGIYFHSKSEKYQQLELKHVHDYGSQCATEFA